MKQFSTRIKIFMLAMMMSLAIPMLVNAQPAPPDGDDIDTPFDGGISLILAVGGIVGAKKAYNKKNK